MEEEVNDVCVCVWNPSVINADKLRNFRKQLNLIIDTDRVRLEHGFLWKYKNNYMICQQL